MSDDITVEGNLIQIIGQSRQNALKKVNEELINMYWKVGEYLSMARSVLPILILWLKRYKMLFQE